MSQITDLWGQREWLGTGALTGAILTPIITGWVKVALARLRGQQAHEKSTDDLVRDIVANYQSAMAQIGTLATEVNALKTNEQRMGDELEKSRNSMQRLQLSQKALIEDHAQLKLRVLMLVNSWNAIVAATGVADEFKAFAMQIQDVERWLKNSAANTEQMGFDAGLGTGQRIGDWEDPHTEALRREIESRREKRFPQNP